MALVLYSSLELPHRHAAVLRSCVVEQEAVALRNKKFMVHTLVSENALLCRSWYGLGIVFRVHDASKITVVS
jgi:hypothetical protein